MFYCFICIKYGHSVNRCSLRLFCSRIYNVVRTYNNYCIGFGKLGIDIIHFIELFIGNIRFAEKHVHVSRHSACYRVNSKFYFCTLCFKLIAELLYKVLSLSKCHSVTGNDYNFFSFV